MSTIEAAAKQVAPMSLKSWAMLLLLGLIWGGSFFFARVAVSEIHPLTLVLLRVAIAAAALHVYLAATGTSFRMVLPFAGSFAVLAVLNNVIPFSLIFAGQTQLGAGLASALNATTPFWTAMFANALTQDEKLTWNKTLGILLGIAGTAAMIGPGLVAGIGGPVWPKFALIGASCSYALALMVAKRFKGIPPAVVAAAQLTASSAIMLPIAFATGGLFALPSTSGHVWAAVFALALLSTAFAYLLFFRLVANAGAINTSLVTLIVPASAILLGALFLQERMELIEILGMAAIAAGLVTIDGRVFTAWKAHGS